MGGGVAIAAGVVGWVALRATKIDANLVASVVLGETFDAAIGLGSVWESGAVASFGILAIVTRPATRAAFARLVAIGEFTRAVCAPGALEEGALYVGIGHI